MRLNQESSRSLVLSAMWLVGADFALQGAAQTSAPPALPPSSTPGTSATRSSADQKGSEPGVWHHFGEGQAKAAPATSQSGTWHHFGEGNNAPPQPPRISARRTLGWSRTQEMERLMYELVNRDRADPANTPETNGQALALRWNDQLAAVARAHSLDMLNQGYFAHEDPQGRNVAGRVEAAGIAWQALGENIAIAASVERAQGAFMNEPRFAKNHRANILSTTYTDVGIGIVQGPDGRVYVTQDFYTAPSRR
jgi:uncharacterized protein YkwD